MVGRLPPASASSCSPGVARSLISSQLFSGVVAAQSRLSRHQRHPHQAKSATGFGQWYSSTLQRRLSVGTGQSAPPNWAAGHKGPPTTKCRLYGTWVHRPRELPTRSLCCWACKCSVPRSQPSGSFNLPLAGPWTAVSGNAPLSAPLFINTTVRLQHNTISQSHPYTAITSAQYGQTACDHSSSVQVQAKRRQHVLHARENGTCVPFRMCDNRPSDDHTCLITPMVPVLRALRASILLSC
jgi:hypothetical protein